jgi:NAD(P)-dependent dehydrogenase (short-subunit alcohol dehydrogenase family)
MTKKIIVTGASRGIGFELVQKYAEAGHEVIALSRNLDRLEQLKEACLKLNPKAVVHILSFDLAKEDIAAQLMPFIESCFQHVDILINNAGALIAKPFTEISAKELERIYQVNVLSVFKLTQELIPKFSYNAHIVNISSVGGIQGSVKFSGLSAYSSSKAALVALTECLAEEYKETDLAFNCLALGAVQTEMLEEAFPGYQAPTSAIDMAAYIFDFSINGQNFYKGKVLNVSKSTP